MKQSWYSLQVSRHMVKQWQNLWNVKDCSWSRIKFVFFFISCFNTANTLCQKKFLWLFLSVISKQKFPFSMTYSTDLPEEVLASEISTKIILTSNVTNPTKKNELNAEQVTCIHVSDCILQRILTIILTHYLATNKNICHSSWYIK